MTVGGQTPVIYTPDNANRLTQISQGSATVLFGYDNDSRRTSLTLPNGVSMNYSYDVASQLTGITYKNGSTTLGNLTYSYDLAGRRTGVGGSYARTGTPLAASSATYNVNNQLTQWKGASLAYDANGNLTSDGTNTYTWNARNQLVSISGGASASFQYDPFGRRVSKTIGGMTQYLYDGANPVQEISGTTASANLLTGGVDEYFQRTDSAGARNFLTDALGSTLALADSTGALQTQYTFEPFGNTSVTGAATSNGFAYTGRELDATGLYFYRARYYNPQLQRFVSEDPIGYASNTVNFYSYVTNEPILYTDPRGLDVQIGIGDSLSLFILTFGVGGGGSVGISTNGTLSGTSFYLNENVDVMVGGGLFAGVGAGLVFGHTDGPLTGGTAALGYGEVDIGAGEAVSVSGSYDPAKGDIGVGIGAPVKLLPGLGVGAAVGVGVSVSSTQVTPTLGQMWNRLVRDARAALATIFGRKSR
jgi:RHS repeat-associated protein